MFYIDGFYENNDVSENSEISFIIKYNNKK